MRVLRDESTHALIGFGNDGSVGVIYFHDNETDAEIDAAFLNMLGGNVRVEICTLGKLEEGIQREVDLMISTLLKQIIERNKK